MWLYIYGLYNTLADVYNWAICDYLLFIWFQNDLNITIYLNYVIIT